LAYLDQTCGRIPNEFTVHRRLLCDFSGVIQRKLWKAMGPYRSGEQQPFYHRKSNCLMLSIDADDASV
jgi:hypothetical protein